MMVSYKIVIPEKAGIQGSRICLKDWIPVYMGMTNMKISNDK
jgi:hypothetical protein